MLAQTREYALEAGPFEAMLFSCRSLESWLSRHVVGLAHTCFVVLMREALIPNTTAYQFLTSTTEQGLNQCARECKRIREGLVANTWNVGTPFRTSLNKVDSSVII